MDVLLSAFIRSTEEPESDRLLGELIVVHATPYIRRTLRQRLGLHIGQSGANPNNPQAEDLYQDVVTKVIQWLKDLKLKPEQKSVRDFGQYVSRIAANVCNDYLREKSPARYRLKNNLRDLLESHRDFALWRTESNTFVCAFKSLVTSKEIQPSRRLEMLEQNLDSFIELAFSGRVVHLVPLPEIVAAIFKRVSSPIEFDRLVHIVGQILDLREQTFEPLDDAEEYWSERCVDVSIRSISQVELRGALQEVWHEIKQLPEKQREALCLSFEYENGTDLFSLLIDAGISTISQIAIDLDIPPLYVLYLWKVMPMNNVAIATHLGVTREQVNKWRYRALKQLRKNLRGS